MGRGGTLGRALLRARDSGAFGRSLLSAAALTDALSLLSASELYPQYDTGPTNDVSSSSTTPADLGVAFTPTAGRTYLCEFWVCSYSATATTGPIVQVDGGNCVVGAVYLNTVGTAVGNNVPNRGSLPAGAVSVTGGIHLGSSGRILTFGTAIITAHASAPTSVKLQVGSEVGGSAVVFPAGESVLRYKWIPNT